LPSIDAAHQKEYKIQMVKTGCAPVQHFKKEEITKHKHILEIRSQIFGVVLEIRV
jgi:hypothetical protein